MVFGKANIASLSKYDTNNTGWPTKSKPLPNDQKIVSNRFKASQ